MSDLDVSKPVGLAWMEAIRDGVVPPPPAATHLGLVVEAVSVGTSTFLFTADERFSNGNTTHGGILAAVADFALTTAVLTQLDGPAERVLSGLVTTNLAVTYLGPVRLGGRYRCQAEVVHLGRTLAHAEAVLSDDAGRVLMRATATCHVRDGSG